MEYPTPVEYPTMKRHGRTIKTSCGGKEVNLEKLYTSPLHDFLELANYSNSKKTGECEGPAERTLREFKLLYMRVYGEYIIGYTNGG